MSRSRTGPSPFWLSLWPLRRDRSSRHAGSAREHRCEAPYDELAVATRLPPARRWTGAVLWFKTSQGYGFIRRFEDGAHVYVDEDAIERSGLIGIVPGQEVEFEVVQRIGSHVKAAKLRLLAAYGSEE